MEAKNNDKHIYGIDALRFFSAILVSVFHFTWPRSEVVMAMPFGWIGVQIFFVISGVVIASSAAKTTPSRFVVGRLLRLYPAAWLAALINVTVILMLPSSAYQSMGISVNPHLGAFLQSLTLFGNYFLASSYWTLPIEIAFYLIIFIAILLCDQPRLDAIAKGLVLLGFPYGILSCFHHIDLINAPWLDLGYGLKNTLLVRHAPFFALGIFIWTIKKKDIATRSDQIAFVIAICLAGIEIYSRASGLLGIYPSGENGQISLRYLVASSLITFLIFLLAIYASVKYNNRLNPKSGTKKVLRAMGLVTYPFYLIHEAVGGHILYHLTSLRLSLATSIAVSLFCVGVVAYAIAILGEPFIRKYLQGVVNQVQAIGIQIYKSLTAKRS